MKKKFVRVIVPINSEYLIISENREGAYWNFPGGKVEIDESIQEACLREVYEETSLLIEKIDFLHKFVFNEWEGYYFLARRYSGQICLKEKKSIEYKSISLDEFLDYSAYIYIIMNYIKESIHL